MVSAVVLTHNSGNSIRRCLRSLTWCDQIVVVDDFSTDQTLKICKQFPTQIFTRHLNNNWSAQRNYALKQTSHPWVLFVDSDEYVTPALRKEIINTLRHSNYQGFYLRRRDLIFGTTLKAGETAHVNLLRLANKNFGSWRRPVHEVWNVRGKLGQLKEPLIHQRQLTISQFIERINHYTSLEHQTFHYSHLLKPKLKFLYNYIYLRGFIDGMAGFIMAYLMSLHSLVVRVKAWEKHAL